MTRQAVYGGEANKERRVKVAVRDYVSAGRELSAKVRASLLALCDQRGPERGGGRPAAGPLWGGTDRQPLL
jgi:hypothetical protein